MSAQASHGIPVVFVREVDADPARSDKGRMVAALLTLGIPLFEVRPYDDTRELLPNGREQRVVTWCLRDRSLDGKHVTAELIAAWNDPGWLVLHPEHPLAYVKKALENHHDLGTHVRKYVPHALVRSGRRAVLIPMDATPAEKRQLLDSFRKPVAAV